MIQKILMMVDGSFAAEAGARYAFALAKAAAEGRLVESANIVFAGTTVLSGTARVVIFATGMNTEFGKIAHLTSGVEAEMSPLQLEIRKVTRLVAAISVGIGLRTAAFEGGFWWPLLVFALLLLLAEEARKGIVRRLDPGRGLRYQEGTA